MTNFVNDSQDIIAERIGGIRELQGQDVRIIKQNKKELSYLIDCDLAQVSGLLVVVAATRVKPFQASTATVYVDVMVSETVALHRLGGDDVLTAIDVAQLIGEELGQPGSGIGWRDLSHDAGPDSVLIATVKLEMVLKKKEG